MRTDQSGGTGFGPPALIGVVIADDHEVVRRGLGMTIAGEPDMQLLGAATTGAEAIALVQATQPDVVLLDIHMPDTDGIAAAAALRAAHPALPILMLTSYSDDARIYAALRAGASGYLLKEMSGDALVAAIRAAARGEPQLHPKIARRLMDRVLPPTDPLAQLSPREHEVLRWIARGLSNKEIALATDLTEQTVKSYVRDILSKLNVADRTQAALVAVRYGAMWNEPEPPP
ncbi:MAG: response regulator transcription factor [Chloroflexales bacterium]|nr:response regulator transcription factor [Chloroflexales bacterium]